MVLFLIFFTSSFLKEYIPRVFLGEIDENNPRISQVNIIKRIGGQQ